MNNLELTFIKILLIIGAGMAAGFINVLAGGGSLITLPVLIFLGLPSALANGTNRIALMVQSISAVTNFRNKGYFNYKLSIFLALPAILGSIIGSQLAISIPDKIFNLILAFVMIIMLILILWQPGKRFKQKEEEPWSNTKKFLSLVAFFFVGLYGGFIQGGVGIIIIVALSVVSGMSLVEINSMKAMVIGIYMFFSLLVFILNGQVNWLAGLLLAIGNSAGAWLGSSFAVEKGDKWIRVVLTVVIIVLAGRLLLITLI